MYYCGICSFKSEIIEDLDAHLIWHNDNSKQEAIRNPTSVRYDILDPEFLEALAKIAHYGAITYGEFNWHKSRLTGDKGPINHIMKHIILYQQNRQYDHIEVGNGHKYHLAAIAFNAMMEFWYYSQEEWAMNNPEKVDELQAKKETSPLLEKKCIHGIPMNFHCPICFLD